MTARLSSFVIWALVAASAVFWGLKLGTTGTRAPAHAAVVATDAAVAGADLSRLFGSAPVAPAATPATEALAPADARFKLLGVAAGRSGRSLPGLALIAVDGKPARAFAVGATVDAASGLQVVSVTHRRVELGPRDGPARMALELPALAEAARGSLPAAGATAPAAAVPPPAPQQATPRYGQPQPQPQPAQDGMPTTPDIPPAVAPPVMGRGLLDSQGVSNTQ